MTWDAEPRLGPRPFTAEEHAAMVSELVTTVLRARERRIMGVRAKFRVDEIRTHAWNNGAGAKTVVLVPSYDQSIPEDRRFYDATPTGRFEMLVNNPAALDQLALGQYFYIDLTPVEP